MGSSLHWVILLLSTLLAVGAGCTNGNDADSETAPAIPTPDFPAAGSESDPGDPEPTEETGSKPAGARSSAVPAEDAANVALRPIAPAELEQLVAQHKGNAVLFDFWATWCVPCVQQYPHTVELSKTHEKDLVVYTVSFDETDEESLAAVKKFHADKGLGNVVPLLSSDGGSEESYEGFDITGGALPHYKVFDREGQLVATLGGDVDNPPDAEQVDAAVAKAIRR